jgi:hypothetical protein
VLKITTQKLILSEFDIKLKKKKTTNIKDSSDLNITKIWLVHFEPELKKKIDYNVKLNDN